MFSSSKLDRRGRSVWSTSTAALCIARLFPHLLILGAIGMQAGCGRSSLNVDDARREPESFSDVAASPGLRSSALNSTTRPSLSSEETRRTIELIQAVSGRVIRAEDGSVSGVDVTQTRMPIDEKDVAAIVKLPNLRTLRLAINTMSDETLSLLAAQTQLRELQLRDTPVSDAQFASLLEDMNSLVRLALRRVNGVTNAGLAAIKELPRLEVLSLIEMGISDQGLATLASLEQLRSLDVRRCAGLTSDNLSRLIAMRQLREVKLGGATVDDAALKTVLAIPSLVSLTVEDATITANGLAGIAVGSLADRLRAIALVRCYGVNDDALSVLRNLRHIESLSVRECPVTGEFLLGWDQIAPADLPPLRAIILNSLFLPESAIAVLPRFQTTLTHLNLSDVELSSESMRSVGKLRQLQSLQLGGCSLSDEAVVYLAGLEQLTSLDLSDNYGITDASAKILDALPVLDSLKVENTGMMSGSVHTK